MPTYREAVLVYELQRVQRALAVRHLPGGPFGEATACGLSALSTPVIMWRREDCTCLKCLNTLGVAP